MKNMLKTLVITAAMLPGVTLAAGGTVELPKIDWDFNNPIHEWDKKQLYRGYQVATQVCTACHSFKYINHRVMMNVGFTEAEVKSLADALDMRIDDKLMSALAPADAQEAYGKELPDLSMMNKARNGGADYTYALLTGYDEDHIPADFEGEIYNKYFPGHNIAMPNPLPAGGLVEYEDGTESSVEQMSKDVSYFMQWTAEPERTKRQHTGIYVLIYLLIFTGLCIALKKAVWRDIKKK